jgi:hypothetical protein
MFIFRADEYFNSAKFTPYTGIFQWPNTSGRTMVLGSTQPLTEMGTRNLPLGGGGGGGEGAGGGVMW